ncbi:entericidin A/B family lipoprotein [Roseospira marina]|uniref:Entericidin A/B family lipoprotein n=1 Tax=Roseospira marina TaxID=140057 RepID=A0A5M6IDD1_9PROT|nr:entericidin A/B family lipoprotein [Roseospira marina]KAA5606294.1 entericidin A/B family lipoprotein [Roseospira marina]MBB4314453.1 putative small secreted protein [Roseospira marina]MBB5087613.1 putative small secreted protein [Roseospira marina]
MKKLLTLFSMLGVLAVAACNTAEGVGEDMQDAGEAIEDEAND